MRQNQKLYLGKNLTKHVQNYSIIISNNNKQITKFFVKKMKYNATHIKSFLLKNHFANQKMV